MEINSVAITKLKGFPKHRIKHSLKKRSGHAPALTVCAAENEIWKEKPVSATYQQASDQQRTVELHHTVGLIF